MQKISQALMGCVEIPIFLKSGIARFENSKTAALQSFIVAIALLPVAAWMTPPSVQYAHMSYGALPLEFFLEFIVVSVVYLGAIYAVARQLKCEDAFYRFVNAQNWLNVTQVALMLPVCLGVKTGHWGVQEGYAVLACLLIYGYAYLSFTITHTFRINWMLSTSLAILEMAVNQGAQNLVMDFFF